ncbi:MAG: type II secretion system F family protein [Deltaproteobacteria bacterium]|nr:type II secretion system F family protein [Deltaproteobacteria bacterium]
MELVIALIFGLAVFWFIFSNFEALEKKFSFSLSETVDQTVSELDTLFIEMKPRQVFWFYVLTGSIGFLFFFSMLLPHWIIGFIVGFMWVFFSFRLPKIVIHILVRRRVSKFNSQMIDGLTLLSNALKSGLSIVQGIQVVVDEMPNPFSEEFNLVLSQQKVGVPLDECFTKLAERVPSEDVEMFVTAIVILRETGGNLSETFDTVVHTIRERIKVEKKIGSMVFMGVMQGVIVTAIPFFLLVLLYVIDPQHVTILFTNVWGYVILGIMLFMQLIGGLMIKKIVTIRV